MLLSVTSGTTSTLLDVMNGVRRVHWPEPAVLLEDRDDRSAARREKQGTEIVVASRVNVLPRERSTSARSRGARARQQHEVVSAAIRPLEN